MSNKLLHDHLQKAIAAHAGWKNKFRLFMKGELDLDATTVSKCDVCDFGKWLESAGKAELGHSYREVHEAHVHFHEIAGSVVRKKHGGDVAGAEEALGIGGAFTKASSGLTLLMVSIREHA